MKKFSLVSLAILSLAVCSCSKDSLAGSDGTKSDTRIGVTSIIVTPSLTKSDAVSQTSVSSFVDEAAGVFLNIEKTVEPIDYHVDTKAGEYTTGNLGNFIIDGYLGSEIKSKVAVSDDDKNNQHFIDNKLVTKNGSSWKFESGEYKWRYGINHIFWAYTPNLTSGLTFCNKPNSTEKDTTKTTFSYTSDGIEDILVAYTKKYFGKDEETSLKQPELDLAFTHALAEVQVNVNNIQFKVREPDATSSANDTDAPAGRCSVDKIYFRKVMESGTCTSDQGACTWDNLSGGAIASNVLQLNAGSPSFLIPQDSDPIVLHVEVKDTRRQLTRPYIFEAEEVFNTGNWLSGYKYGYNFTGKFIVPKLPDGENGISTDFSGKEFDSQMVIDDVAVKYIKKIKLTWDGLPTTNGNGTYAFISYELPNVTPAVSDYMNGSNNPNTSNSNIGFVFDCFNRLAKKGTVVGGVNNTCTCTIELPDNVTGDICIWSAYIGGSNGAGACGWTMKNMKLEIEEWR